MKAKLYNKSEYKKVFSLTNRDILKEFFKYDTAQKMKFFIKDFLSKCGQIRMITRLTGGSGF